MITLCGFAVSNYYNKIKIILREKGVPFEEEYVGLNRDTARLAQSPQRKIPFIDIDGRILTESQAIAEYLEDVYPVPRLYPQDAYERARCRELVEVIDLYLELPARTLYKQAFFGGTVGAALVARAPADGYTMLIGNPAHTYAPLIYPSSGFDLMRDFAPISALARVPQALIVNPAVLDVSSLQQFIDAARARPNTIDVGSSGIGTRQPSRHRAAPGDRRTRNRPARGSGRGSRSDHCARPRGRALRRGH